jgi:coiled-coil domain-containing protein 130
MGCTAGVQIAVHERVEELCEKAEVWMDPCDINTKLRQGMRAKRKVWTKEETHKEGIQEKFSLGLDIADETDANRQSAGLIEFGGVGDDAKSWKPLFATSGGDETDHARSKTKKLKAEAAAKKSRKDLQHKLMGNTRAAVDSFVSREMASKARPNIGILKRKRDAEVPSEPQGLRAQH